MAKSVIKFWDKIIVVLLGIAGIFSGCKSDTGECEPYSFRYPYPDSLMVLMYGVIQADFAIKGTVTDKEGKAIPNISIVGQTKDNRILGSDFTNLKGQYVLNNYFLNQESIIYLKFEDIDGEENGGHFATKEIKMKLTNAEKEKIEECKQDDGVFTKTQNIELKKK